MPVLPALLVVLAVAPPLVLEPAERSPAASSTPAAQVVAVHGPVVSSVGKASFPVTRGVLLDGTDVVNVREGGWVALLLLHNGHVVRLDEDVNLAVANLALFKAKPAGEDTQSQLDRLLSRRERESLPKERLIGWHQGQSAANARAANEARKESNAGPPSGLGLIGVGPGGGGQGPGSIGHGPARPPAPAPSPVSSTPPAAPPSTTERKKVPPPPPPSTTDDLEEVESAGGRSKAELSRRPERRAVAKESKEANLVADESLRACVRAAALREGPDVLSALGEGVQLRFRLVDEGIQVSTGGALPMDACFVAWANVRKPLLTPKWQQVLVTLK